MGWLRSRVRGVVEPVAPVAPTDARPLDGPRRSDPDPESARSERRRRRVRLLVFNVVLFGGLLAAVVGRGGLLDLIRHREQREEARRKVVDQRARVEALRQAIVELERDPLARERIAREELGLAQPGEIQFLLPRSRTEAWTEELPEPPRGDAPAPEGEGPGG